MNGTIEPMGSLALEVANVSVAYGKRQVLDDVTLSVKPGEIFGLIGLNGVGKTTLIKTILNLNKADSGSIDLFGRSSEEAAARHTIAYLPEHLQPSRYLKGREFIDLSLSYFGIRVGELDEDARSLALAPEALSRKIATYSKGMIQKVGLLATLLSERSLLILDEPMTGLDPRARILLKDRLEAYRDGGGAIFFSSHILSDIDEICDRVAVIDGGRIVFGGTPDEMKEKFGSQSLERAFLMALDEPRPE